MKKLFFLLLIPVISFSQEPCCGIERSCYDYSVSCGQVCLERANQLLNLLNEAEDNLDSYYDDLNIFGTDIEKSLQLKIIFQSESR